MRALAVFAMLMACHNAPAATAVSGRIAIRADEKGFAPSSITLEKDKPLTLTWTAKGASADSTIHVHLDISHHGGTKGQIECDTADSGSLTIGASLVTQLVNLGVAGFPTVRLTRSSVGSKRATFSTSWPPCCGRYS